MRHLCADWLVRLQLLNVLTYSAVNLIYIVIGQCLSASRYLICDDFTVKRVVNFVVFAHQTIILNHHLTKIEKKLKGIMFTKYSNNQLVFYSY